MITALIAMFCGVALAIFMHTSQVSKAKKVSRAILVETIAMYKQKAQNTGFSIGWKGSWRSYYRYKDVLDHYECVFSVVYNDGKTGTIKCRQDSEIYNILIWKTM